MLLQLTENILEQWNKLFPVREKPNKIDYLGLPGSIAGGTSTFLGFVDFEKNPLLAVKVHRHNNTDILAKNEKNILEYLEKYNKDLGSSLPQLILSTKINGVWVLVESILKGKPMLAKMHNDGLPVVDDAIKNIGLAKKWNIHFNKISSYQDHRLSTLHLKRMSRQTSEFRKLFRLNQKEFNVLSQAEKVVSDFIKKNKQIFICHGDFCRHNILLSNEANKLKFNVIDWTFSRKSSIFLYDFFFFVSTYALQIRNEYGISGFIKIFERTFFEDNDYNYFIKECLRDYCRIFNINFTSVKFHFCIFLIEQALFEYKQLLKCSSYGSLPRINTYLSSLKNNDYNQALKENIWFYFFQSFVKKYKELTL